MSARATTWAWEHDLASGAKLTLLAVADEAQADGVAAGLVRAEITARTGIKPRTVSTHLAALEEAGLLYRIACFDGGDRVADVIVLRLPGHPSEDVVMCRFGKGGRFGKTGRSSTTTSESYGNGKDDSEGGTKDVPSHSGQGVRRAVEMLVRDWPENLPSEMLTDAKELLRRKVKVDGKMVSATEMYTAAVAISTFNAESGSEYGLGAHMKSVVMRIRERPSWDAARHQRLVQSAWRLRWWEKMGRGGRRRPTPAVVYGNDRVFEQVAQDAADEAKGEEPKPVRGRFDRSAPTE